MHSKLTRDFFNRPTILVAKELLGKFLVRKVGRKIIAGMIVEIEAYCGPKDLASHASRGRTSRTEVMFGPSGHAYIYLIYGMYHCFNVVTEQVDYPAAVLIRGVALTPITFQHSQECWNVIGGPGKVCRYFKIDRNLNKEDLITSKKLWLEDRGAKISKSRIKRKTRVGIDYAKNYKDKLWRFSIKN